MDTTQNTTSYRHCLNCQTELQGDYCHVCGQRASNARPTVKEFFLEYLNIAFIWDTQFLKTVWQLVRKPGHVTNEYISGKFISYMHPLKLNMFLLFVFITFVLLFHKDLGDSIQTFTRNEVTYPLLQMQILADNDEYSENLKSSPMDTVQLYAPLMLADQFPDIISVVDVIDSTTPGDSMMVWTAALPHILIEDEVITQDRKGYYYFNEKDKTGVLGTEFMETIWRQMVKLTTTYFPIFILLTVPFLAFLLHLTQRKRKYSKFRHLIFALHYTALLEMLIIFLYIIHLIAAPPMWVMQWILILGSCVYLTSAIRRVYETKRWFNAAVQAIFTNIGYAVIFMLLFITIFIIASIIVAVQLL